jgi:peptidoglycan/LPS O-acetylase OafA/YrhL
MDVRDTLDGAALRAGASGCRESAWKKRRHTTGLDQRRLLSRIAGPSQVRRSTIDIQVLQGGGRMRRVAELDSIRGLAALAVMVYHLNSPAFLFQGVRVDLFLVLSGYLVTTIVLDRADAENFYLAFQARRVLRIWPIYYLTLAAVVAVNACLARSTAIDALPNYLTFTQNIQRYWSDSVPPFKWYYVHTWSLALEQQFYLFWPILLGLAGRRRLVRLAVGLMAVSVTARALGYHWWILIARCDGFALGSILAGVFADRERAEAMRAVYGRRLRLALGVSVSFLLATLPFSLGLDFDQSMSLGPSLTILGFNLVFFSLIGLVVCFSGDPALRVLRDSRLKYLGVISYGLYIYHPLVYNCVGRVSGRLGLGESWRTDLVKLVASVVLAGLSWRFVERPFLALRDLFEYGPARSGRGARASAALHGAEA